MIDLLVQIREAFDAGDDRYAQKNIALRKAYDEIERLRTRVKQLEGQPRILNSNRNSFM